jgi:hypothetical protein
MTFDELIDGIRAMDFAGLVRSADDSLPELLSVATNLFDHFPRSTQALVMAMMLGMMHAVMEGENVEGELTLGVIITSVERMRIFQAQYDVTFRDAMEQRALDQTAPKPTVN